MTSTASRRPARDAARAVTCVLAGTLATVACAPPPQCEAKAPLVTADGWVFVPPADDAVWPAPEGAPLCTADDIQIASFGEDDAVEIDTRFGCGWATVEQPLLAAVEAGDALQVRVFYFSQTTFPEAEAEVAVALGDDIVVREAVAIPSSSGLVAPRVVVDRAVPAGTMARFHVGNHGDNSWNLIELSRVRTAPCDPEAP